MSKIKLLQMFPSTLRGGAEEYALTIGTAAARKGWDVHVAFPRRDRTAALRHDFSDIGACYHSLEIPAEASGRAQFLIQVVRTLALLLMIKPDAVHLSLPFPDQCMGSMVACALLKIPTVVAFQLVKEELSIGKRQDKLCHWARGRNQKWIAISENNRELLTKLFRVIKNDIDLIYNGPFFKRDDNIINKKTSILLEVRKEIGLSDGDIIVLTVGRLHRQKGYSYIIPAIPHILKNHPNARFVWVGEGEQRNELKLLLKEYAIDDRVIFLGYRNDIPRLLMASNLFLFPTLFEGGSSIALTEAMEFGLPIVASRASGIPEVIEDNKHGVLFTKADSCSLLAALNWALDHPEKMDEMAIKASMRVKDFSSEKMTNKTLVLICTLVGIECQDYEVDNVLI